MKKPSDPEIELFRQIAGASAAALAATVTEHVPGAELIAIFVHPSGDCVTCTTIEPERARRILLDAEQRCAAGPPNRQLDLDDEELGLRRARGMLDS